MNDTIYALSSGQAPSGVAIFRLSGPACVGVFDTMCGGVPKARSALLRDILSKTGELLDRGVVLWFPGPSSFTGEDCLEFQVHGGRAVVAAFLSAFSEFDDLRLAYAGEFSRRAFENGKMDLTQLEGLSDLVASETEMQRIQAVSLAGGALREKYDEWRSTLIKTRAYIEAELDFTDEEDIPDSVSDQVWGTLGKLRDDISSFLDAESGGEIIRDGFRIALMGRPNAGKSSLLNALVGRDLAIVTPEAGTTRDLIEARLDIGGYLVVVVDTAGIREEAGLVESEGIRRALAAGSDSDLVIWLEDISSGSDFEQGYIPDEALVVRSHDDEGGWDGLSVSVRRPESIDNLLDIMSDILNSKIGHSESSLIARQRQKAGLVQTVGFINEALSHGSLDIVKAAEGMRFASNELGKLTGALDVEDLLDVIFSEFCVGK